jgi:hypothetical protein
MADMKWRDAILRVLREADGPLHYREIAQLIIDNGYRQSVGATPAATVAANLGNADVRPLVRRVSRGVYELGTPSLAASATGSESLAGPSTAASIELADEPDPEAEMGLINAFGMFWMRQEVDWSNRSPKILGAQQTGSVPVDFSTQAGVYLLYDGSRVVYVGRVSAPRLGTRLWEHTRDRLTSRWDRFSWFGVRSVRPDGALAPIPKGNIQIDVLIATMEALLIEGLEPPQNRRQGDGFSALEFIQVTDPEVEKSRTQAVLVRAMSGLT